MNARLTCRQASELLSQAEERKLGALERTRLKLHLAVCAGCRNFERQLAFIRKAFHRFSGDDEHPR